MLLLGLTGNIASGKSTVAAYLKARGIVLIDSDADARRAVEPGSAALAAITTRFGAAVLGADGTLDRAALGRRVFADAAARHELERIVHPAVESQRLAALADARRAGAAAAVCDIPLLFEAKLAWQFPRIIVVDASAATRIKRLVRDRGMPPDDAASRVRAQLSSALKRPRADLVVDNDGTRDDLSQRLDAAWATIARWHPVAAGNRAAR